MDLFADPSNVVEPVISPVNEIVRAVASFVAVLAAPPALVEPA